MADCTPEAGRRGRIAENLRRLAIADLMIVVGLIGLAVFFISRPIHGRDDLEPHLIRREGSLPENLLRFTWFSGVPLLAIGWHRWRGRRGIIAGFLGGILCYGSYILCIDPYLPHHDLGRFPVLGNFIYFSILGAAHGFILGLAAWGMATLVRNADANKLAAPDH
jgi:hypothetical protein